MSKTIYRLSTEKPMLFAQREFMKRTLDQLIEDADPGAVGVILDSGVRLEKLDELSKRERIALQLAPSFVMGDAAPFVDWHATFEAADQFMRFEEAARSQP